MKAHTLLLAAGLLAAAPIAAFAKIERVVEKSFTVQPGGLLEVETSGGDVRVVTGSEPTVKVVAKEVFRTSSESEADEIAKDLTLTIEQSPSGVVAKAKYEKHFTGFHWASWPPVQVSFTVTVPATYNAKLKTSGGDIAVADLAGTVHARTSGGNIALGKIAGDIDAGTSGGDVRLTEGAATVKLSTSGGNITVDRAVGPADLGTSGGDIRIGSVENTVHASTSGGNVFAGIAGLLKGDCSLHTSGGEVKVKVDRTAAFDLDASTSGGDVEAAGLTLTIERGGTGRSHLAGKVNGGGPLLKLRTSGGDIRLEPR